MQCSEREALKTLSVKSGESLEALLHYLRQQQEATTNWQEAGGHLRNGSWNWPTCYFDDQHCGREQREALARDGQRTSFIAGDMRFLDGTKSQISEESPGLLKPFPPYATSYH